MGNSSAAKMKVKNIKDLNLGESREAEFQSHKNCVCKSSIFVNINRVNKTIF